jgi:DNA mismatch endonuclease (patch repair protein)
MGARFRKDYRIALDATHVRADVAFPRLKLAVFIDGCFWHSCPLHRTVPRHNAWYWRPKLRRNAQRDRRSARLLAKVGWTPVRYWEHVEPLVIAKEVHALLRSRLASSERGRRRAAC